jgi:5-methyltetrahydropteroyltriglutamate--homocysteine methyltransferase
MEPVAEVKDGIRKTLELLPPERVWILPDCGLKTRTVEETVAKCRVVVEAAKKVRAELRAKVPA